MQYKQLSVLMFLLVGALGCGGDSSGSVAGGSTGGGGEFTSLLEAAYTVEKLSADLGDASLQVAKDLQNRLEAAIADSREQVSRLKLDVQRFSADALLSSKARATRDALESRKGALSLLESKLAAVLKHAGQGQAPGK